MKTPLVELYERAQIHARRMGYRQEASDFGAWYTVKLLEGRGQKQTITQAFVDFLRSEFGARDTKRAKLRLALRAAQGSIPRDFRGSMDRALELQLGRDGVALEEDPEALLLKRERERAGRGTVSCIRKQKILELVRDGVGPREIALLFDLSEDRIFQLLRELKAELKRKADAGKTGGEWVFP